MNKIVISFMLSVYFVTNFAADPWKGSDYLLREGQWFVDYAPGEVSAEQEFIDLGDESDESPEEQSIEIEGFISFEPEDIKAAKNRQIIDTLRGINAESYADLGYRLAKNVIELYGQQGAEMQSKELRGMASERVDLFNQSLKNKTKRELVDLLKGFKILQILRKNFNLNKKHEDLIIRALLIKDKPYQSKFHIGDHYRRVAHHQALDTINALGAKTAWNDSVKIIHGYPEALASFKSVIKGKTIDELAVFLRSAWIMRILSKKSLLYKEYVLPVIQELIKRAQA